MLYNRKKLVQFINSVVVFGLAALIMLGVLPPVTLTMATPLAHVEASTEMRGLWVTSAYNLDWPSRQGLTPAEIRREIDVILERSAAQGINAVFVQVRPVADALHRSEIFPWSHLLTGTQGQAPADNFSPLEYWIERGHAMGIEVHAWLNPYRVTFPNQQITDPTRLSENHPARLNPDLVIAYRNSLFFDPGNPAARELILDGVRELLTKYNLDGIHLDDYFYPSSSFPDQATFARYNNGMTDLHDWRRENVNTLIRDMQTAVRETNPRARFGVSPFAIWKNNTTDPRGSATAGAESYHRMYADTLRWVQEGWVDYIAPQIYWFAGFEIACYEVLITWWEDAVRGTDVDLYIGLAVYREVQNRAGWDGEIVRQLERNARSDVVRGSIFFRAEHMNSSVGDAIAEFYGYHLPSKVPTPPADTPAVIMDRLIVAQPSANRSITAVTDFWFFGSAVPNVPVYVNGQEITNRTAEGFFSIFLPLASGQQNSFTFTQEGQPSITRVITNNLSPGAVAPTPMAQAAVINPFPAHDEWARVGTTLTLRATAPAGATVTAEIGGQTVQLTQTNPNLTATANNITAAQFTGSFTLSTDAPPDAIIDIGRPVYTMTWNGQTASATAAGTFRQIGFEAPFFAEITSNTAWAFPNPTTAGGSHWMMQRNQTDRVAAITTVPTLISGRWVDVEWTRLASGVWLDSANLRTFRNAELLPDYVPNFGFDLGFLSEGLYIPGEFEDIIRWESSINPAIFAEFDGSELVVTLGMQSSAPPIFYNLNETLFSSIEIGVHNGAPAYFMTLREGANLEGFYVRRENNHTELVLRRRRPLTPGNYPFAGFTFVIDPGHGGRDPGAIGPMGAEMSEARIVLAQSLLLADRLEMLGAEVHLVRDRDVYLTLQERVNFTPQIKPDMFISLHNNATAETTNATNIRGFTVWFRNPNSLPAADSFMRSMYSVNPGTTRNLAPSQANFFVVRPTWSPAILLEASFMNNIQDFAWMINERHQIDYVWGIVNALLRYYG